MKIYTIGRGESNAIHIDNEYVSRQHAFLKVYPSGKMEIIDKSSNGTAINGRKLKPNVPYRVKRKDVVTFAGQAHLDWKEIPDPLKGYKIAILCFVIIAVLVGAFFALKPLFKGKSTDISGPGDAVGGTGMGQEQVTPVDSSKKADGTVVDVDAELKKMADDEKKRRKAAERKKQAEEKKKAEEREKAIQDSIKKAALQADTTGTGMTLGL